MFFILTNGILRREEFHGEDISQNNSRAHHVGGKRSSLSFYTCLILLLSGFISIPSRGIFEKKSLLSYFVIFGTYKKHKICDKRFHFRRTVTVSSKLLVSACSPFYGGSNDVIIDLITSFINRNIIFQKPADGTFWQKTVPPRRYQSK